MLAPPLSRNEFFAVIVSLVSALFARAWLSTELVASGMPALIARDAAFLAVPLILLILLAPLLARRRRLLASLFPRSSWCRSMVFKSIAVGLLLRLFAWCLVVGSVAFGWSASSNPNAVVGPQFNFQCQPITVVLLGFFVMALVVPMVEETCNRGLIISYLQRFGIIASATVSALLFAVLHPSSSWLFAFVAGLVFATQYWLARSLWPSMISHATVNAIIQLDWRCLKGQWNPPAEALPLWQPGVAAVLIGMSCLIAIGALIDVKALGRPALPEDSPSKRVGDTLDNM